VQQTEAIVKKATKSAPPAHYGAPPTFVSLLSGWVQRGVESFFATQRILVDIAMRQNSAATKTIREGIFDPDHSPVTILTDLAMEGTSSFVEAQKILLHLAQQENEIMMNAGKERVAGSTRAMAVTDLVRRSLDTFIRMQEDFLTTTNKQTQQWLESVKAGKGYENTHLADLARDGMETFVQAQKKFLDVIAQESVKAASGKPEASRTIKKTELSKLANEATNSFIEAQKRLLDVVNQQATVNLKAATQTIKLMSSSRFLPVANLTGDGVKSFVTAEKALIESIIKPGNMKETRTPGHRPAQSAHHKATKAKAAHA
jgi:hypothetical protein